MYITYEPDQWRIFHSYGWVQRPNSKSNEVKDIVNQTPNEVIYGPKNSSTYIPTWLVDTYDMTVVRGEDVQKPRRYFALSYSWNQSGDYFENENGDGYTRNDQGKHRIVFYRKKTKKKYPRGRRKVRVYHKTRFVKFEALVQRICKDFGARYVWWDQMCIDQSNEEERKREIKNMHKIYQSADCTLVLIPELDFTGCRCWLMSNYEIANMESIKQAEWTKRVWTLEEAFVSRKLLFIGRNVHMWSSQAATDNLWPSIESHNDFLYNICRKSVKWNACIALRLARERTSTKDRDRYLALANMFPDKMEGFNFSDNQPLWDMMIRFYELLARDDPSILFFGAREATENTTNYERTAIHKIGNKSMPSWTGIDGVHVERLFNEGFKGKVQKWKLSSTDYSVIEGSMYLTCASISVCIVKEGSYDNSFRSWGSLLRDVDQRYRRSSTKMKPSSGNSLTFVATTEESAFYCGLFRLYGVETTHFLPLKKEGNTLVNTLSSPTIFGGGLSLTEDCTHCTILFGVSFEKSKSNEHVLPVITKNGDCYKAIGLCILPKLEEYSDLDTKTKQTFVVK